MPPPPASRPLALPAGPLPSGPTAGGLPVTRGGMGLGPARALPSGPRPLDLPSAGGQAGYAPPGHPPPSYPQQLPSGPVAGRGYGAPPGPGSYPPPSIAAPGYPAPQPTTYGGGGTTYGVPAEERPAIASGPAPPTTPAIYGTPPGSSAPGTYGAAPPVEPPAYAAPPRRELTSGRGRPAKPKRSDECAQLRSECEQLRAIATSAAAAAAAAATEAEAAHAEYVTAQRAADEARRAHQNVAREAVEVTNQLAALEHTASEDQQRLQAETTHAAFAAYRRGDISSEQLREVFKRAEGWTPEHDRLSRRVTELRAEEAELVRVRDAAVLTEEANGERARATANTARALDEQSRTAAADARGRCAAAEACEQRLRRR